MKKQGIPSPDEEALQQPTIDPVFFATMAGLMGPASAGRQLVGQVLQNHLLEGLGNAFNRRSQYLPRVPYADKAANMSASVVRKTNPDPIPEEYGNRLRQMRNISQGREMNEAFGGPYEGFGDRATWKFSELMDKLLKGAPEITKEIPE